MSTRTLMLTPWYLPHKVVSWQDAVTMIYLEKVDVVVEYDEELRSPSTTLKAPAVVRLKRKIGGIKKGVKFSRINVYLRDDFTCQYCRQKFPMSQLTYDHVVPRARGGRTCWENIATSCYSCNGGKGNRTPAEAGLKLLTKPHKPRSLPLTPLHLDARKVPTEWRDFLTVVGPGAAIA